MEYITEILQTLVVGDNVLRGQAEQRYEALKRSSNCIMLPPALLHTIGDVTKPIHIRQLAAVLLRRMLVEDCNDGPYKNMSVERYAVVASRYGGMHNDHMVFAVKMLSGLACCSA
jgi:hypothetical protein